MNIAKNILIFLLTIVIAKPLLAAVSIDPEADKIWLGRSLDIVYDVDRTIDIDSFSAGIHDHKMFRVNQDIPTFGYSDGEIYWAKFQLHNPGNTPLELFLVSQYSLTDRLTLYTSTQDGAMTELTLGDQVTFAKRPFAYRYPVFPVRIDPGTSTFYLKLDTTGSVQISLSVTTRARFVENIGMDMLVVGGLCGSIGIMLLYNFFIYLKFRSMSYLLYVLYALMYLIFSLYYHGLLHQFVFTNVENTQFLNKTIWNVIDLIDLFGVMFTIEFLEIRKRSLKIFRLAKITQIWAVINVVNGLTFQFYSYQLTIISSFLMSLVLLFIGGVMAIRYRPARYYILAWTSLLAGNMVFILAGDGILPVNEFTTWGQFAGAAVEMLLLSLALGDRVALLHEERTAIQKKLGIVLQNRVMIVSDLAHKMNNPLNYVTTSIAILRQNQNRFQQVLKSLPDHKNSDASDGIQPQQMLMEGMLHENCELLDTVDAAIGKSARCISEIRSLTGVDGYSRERWVLGRLLEKLQERIREVMGERSLGSLKILDSAEAPLLQQSLYTNETAFGLCFELLFRFWYTHKEKDGFMELVPRSLRVNTLTLHVLVRDEGGKFRDNIDSSILLQVKDILASYGCEVELKAEAGKTKISFVFTTLIIPTQSLESQSSILRSA